MERATPELKFVGLHAHSVAGSPFDALGYPQDHMEAAYENGMNALALTDHGNMNGFSWQVEHAKKMKKAGKDFKPIFGCEAYYVDDVDEWQKEYEKAKEDKKRAKELEKSVSKGVNIEDADRGKKTRLRTNNHFLLLAKNQTGLNNLFKLISTSHEDKYFFRKPRIDLNLLREHSEGLICTTTCISGPFAQVVWDNPDASEKELLALMRPKVEQFLDVFGEDYFGELQWNNIPQQHTLNQCIIKLSKEFGFKLVSTVDSHYPRKGDWKDRELYKRLGWLGMARKPEWLSDEIPEDVDEIGYELHTKNGDEVFESYEKYSYLCGHTYDSELIKESIENTYVIAHDIVEDFMPEATVRLPDFVVSEGKTDNQELMELCVSGLKEFGLDSKDEYVQRLKHEIKVISARGFSKYFLTMKAIADKANQRQLTGAGRGSAAGSLVAYVLGITQIDPIKWGLLFSRFLREDATDYPDIDFDVSDPMTLKNILIDEWGNNVVVPISNWNTLQLRSLIKDISKFYDVPFNKVNAVTGKMLHEATPLAKKKHGIKAGVYTPTFEEVMEFSESLRNFLEEYPHIKTHVLKLYGQVRSCSRHAGGVVIGEDLDKYMPLINSGGVRQTPWSEGQNVRHLEPMGFIKFDILGLASLRMIEGAIKHILVRQGIEEPTFDQIKDYYDKNLHPDVIDLNDQNVFENVFHDGKWAGIFQFTEKGAQNFCKRAKPTSLIDISAITSIFRPGPLSAGVDQDYVDAKNGHTYVDYIHPIVKEVTKETHGFLIFQEQIALLAHKLGKDVSLDEGNKLRKLLTKKGTGKGHEEKDKIYKKFIRGCAEKRIPNGDAENLWKTFEYFSGYGFNKSHAVSYSMLSYQCAYLFNYHPVEWMAAFLDKEPESRKEKAITIAKGMGFEIVPVNINRSGFNWEILGNNKISQPLTSIKGLGEKAIEQVVKHRPFNTIEEFLFHDKVVYSKLNKKALDVLVRSEALDDLMDDRFLCNVHDEKGNVIDQQLGRRLFWKCVAGERPRKVESLEENIENFKGGWEEPVKKTEEMVSYKPFYSNEERIQNLIELTGLYPFHLVILNKDVKRLEEIQVPPLSEFDPQLRAAWFIVREKIVKKTKHGKEYWIIRCIDSAGSTNSIKCWGIKPELDNKRIIINKAYMAVLDYSEQWGFSTRSIKHNFRPLSGEVV